MDHLSFPIVLREWVRALSGATETKRRNDRGYSRAWRLRNPGVANVRTKAWAQANRERSREIKRRSALKRRDQIDNYRKAHRAEAILRAARWAAKNRERYNARVRSWRVKKWAADPAWRLRHILSSRLWHETKRGAGKSAKTKALLGCSIPELRVHLAAQFRPGMSWDNHGEWHIDHIRPCASFDLSRPEQQRECFNFKNLQPLWAKDNLSKGAKYNAA